MRCKLFLCLSYLLLAVFGCTSSGGIGIGDIAPPVDVEVIASPPESSGRSLAESLEGKVVVVTFYSSDVASSDAALSHLTELAEGSRGQAVEYVAVTCDDRDTVTPFIERHRFPGWVGRDSSRALFRKFNVDYFPVSYVLDKQAHISAIAPPQLITSEFLADLVNCQSSDYARASWLFHNTCAWVGSRPDSDVCLFEASISPAAKRDANGGHLYSENFHCDYPRLNSGSISLRRAISYAYGVSEAYIVGPPAFLNTEYDMRFCLVPGDRREIDEPVRSILQGILTSVFSFDVERKTVPREVLILDIDSGEKLKSCVHDDTQPSYVSGVNIGRGSVLGVGSTLDGLILGLERIHQIPVLKANGVDMPDRYDFEIVWNPESKDSLAQALNDSLAITISKDRRPIEVLIVEPQ